MKNVSKLAAIVAASQITACTPDDTGFIIDTTTPNTQECSVGVYSDGEKFHWEYTGDPSKIVAEISFFEGGLKHILRLPSKNTYGTITQFEGGDEITLKGLNSENETICTDPHQLNDDLYLSGDLHANLNALTDEALSSLAGTVSIRITNAVNADEQTMPPRPIYIEDPLTGKVFKELDANTFIENAYAVTTADIYQGEIYVSSDHFAGLENTTLARASLDNLEEIESTELTDEYQHGLQREFFILPEWAQDDPATTSIAGLSWNSYSSEGSMVSEGIGVILDVSNDELRGVDTTTWFDSSQVSSGYDLFANSMALSPKQPTSTQYIGMTLPINVNDNGEEEEGNKEIIAMAEVGKTEPMAILIEAGQVDNALLSTYRNAYPDVKIIELPNPSANGTNPLFFVHSFQAWDKDNGNLGLAVFNLYPDMENRSTIDIYEVTYPLENTGNIASFICGHSTQEASIGRGNIVMPTHDSELMSVMIGGSIGETCEKPVYWIDTSTCELVSKIEPKNPGCEETATTDHWREMSLLQHLYPKTEVVSATSEYNMDILSVLFREL